LVITYGFKAGWFQNKILVEIIDSSNAACIQKAHFFFFGVGVREELWGFGVFLVKGHIGGSFFSLAARQCVFLKKCFVLKFWKNSTKKMLTNRRSTQVQT
jgi:hypothetical protein